MPTFLILCVDDLDGEIWREIVGYKNKYYVSNYGRIKSYYRKKPIILKQSVNSKGYLRVRLSINGKNKWHLVHRIVAKSFINNDNPVENNTVHHLNRDRKDNKVSNLQWLSLKDNIRESRTKQNAGNIRKPKDDNN